MNQPDAVAPERKSAKRMIVLASALVVLGAGTAFLAWLFGINSAEDFRVAGAMVRGGFHPVWKDFVLRRRRRG